MLAAGYALGSAVLLSVGFGLARAFQVLPLASLAAAAVFLYVLRHYPAGAGRSGGGEA
jgi:uncharacterized membrane protein